MQKGPLRFVYLWTMWCERPADAHQAALWRFSLKDVHTGERRGFADLAALVAFLRAQMADADAAGPDEGSGRTN